MPILQAQSLVDSLRAALEQEILRGEIAPGDAVTEQAVAQRYSIARPTAKAAIEQLVSSGLLRRTLNKVARVPQLDGDDVRDLYFSRSIVEKGVVKALARAQPSVRTEGVRRAIDRLRRCDHDDVAEVTDADIEYHRALVDALGSPRVIRLYNTIIGEAHLCMAQTQVHGLRSALRIADEHEMILNAVDKGDAELAANLMDDHLTMARDELVAYLESAGDANA
jgi:DNA-binding GntR family transcriptional regulator